MNRRALIVVLAFLGLAFLGVLLGLYGDRGQRVSWRANTFSRSYVGHKALVHFLEEAGFDVTVNRAHLSSTRVGGIRGLAVLEPATTLEGDRKPWIRLEEAFDRVLVVLPKWHVSPKTFKTAWVENPVPVQLEEVEKIMDGTVPSQLRRSRSDESAHTVRFTDGPAFRIEAPGLQTFVDVPAGAVLAQTEEGPVLARDARRPGLLWLSDPDVLSNGLLSKAENALFAEELFARAFPDRALVLEEVHHGFGWNPSFMRSLFSYPGIVATLNAVFFLLFLAWALTSDWGGRGALLVRDRTRLEQARNVGKLMVRHGFHREGLALYASNLKERLCSWFHLPREWSPEELISYLENYDPSTRPAARAFLGAVRLGARRGQPSERTVLQRAREAHLLFKRGYDGVHSRTSTKGGGSDR